MSRNVPKLSMACPATAGVLRRVGRLGRRRVRGRGRQQMGQRVRPADAGERAGALTSTFGSLLGAPAGVDHDVFAGLRPRR